jgi:beta-lactamase class A
MTKPLLAFLLASLLHAQPSVEAILSTRLEQSMAAYAKSVDGAFGYAVIDLTSGRTISLHGDTVFAQASAIKIPILVTLFRDVAAGRVKLDETVQLTAKDAAGGSGDLQNKLKAANQSLTLNELALLMIRDSDNTATNALIAKAGMARVNALMLSLGLKSTRLRRIMMDGPAALRGDENVSTPLEMARLAAMIYHGKVAGSAEIVTLLKTVKAAVRAAVPPEIEVASKPGSIQGVFTETAIVYLKDRPFVIAVASSALGEEAPNPVRGAASIVLEHFQRLSRINAYGHRVK